MLDVEADLRVSLSCANGVAQDEQLVVVRALNAVPTGLVRLLALGAKLLGADIVSVSTPHPLTSGLAELVILSFRTIVFWGQDAVLVGVAGSA